MEDIFTQHVLLIAGFLLTACLSSIFLKKINFPYTIGLVIIGAVLGYMSDASHVLSPLMHDINLSSDLILYIILPTLIFDAAINIDGRLLLKNIVPILLLAVFALLISAGIIGGILSTASGLSLGAAMLFGVLISATDPVAVIALFNEVGAPKRLVTLVDGESIFNDATAIVLFSIVLSLFYPVAGEVHPGLWYASGQFSVVLLGGLLIGAVVGFVGTFILKLARKDLFYQTSVSFVMAYVSFILADSFECSGILSTLSAGLVLRMRSETVISRSNIQSLEHFWDYFSFIANSFVFLLLGITEIHIFRSLISTGHSLIILVAIAATLLARAVGVYTLIPLYNKFSFIKDKEVIPKSYKHILFWGGLRGAVPVALVLAIPADIAERPIIIHLTFAIILFTLLVQGTTIKKLMNRFGVKPDKSDFLDKEVETSRYPFPSDDMAALVLSKVVETFDEEGFFIRKREGDEGVEYLMKKRVHLVSIALDGPVIKIMTEPQEMRYVNTIIYETLLTLNKTVSSIKDVVKPENLQQLVSKEKDQDSVRVDFDLCKYIPFGNIRTQLKSTTKDGVLREMVQILADSGDIVDVEQTLKEIMDREKAMTTGLGKGIATPHARTNLVDTIKIAVGVKREGVDFDALDGAPVKIFFMILSPKNAPKPHLQVLSAIGRLMTEPGTQISLMNADSAQSFLDILKESLN